MLPLTVLSDVLLSPACVESRESSWWASMGAFVKEQLCFFSEKTLKLMCQRAPARLGMKRSPQRSGVAGDRFLGDFGKDWGVGSCRLVKGDTEGYKYKNKMIYSSKNYRV